MSDIFNPQSKILANVDRLIEHLETGTTSPVLVEIDPSNACNHGCTFCISSYIHLPESQHLETFNRSIMTREVLMNLVKDLIKMKVRAINWTGGGEPTVNPYLGEAIQYVGENSNIKQGIFTNGSRLHTNSLSDNFAKYLSWARISIDFGKKETYEKIRRPKTGAGWDQVMKNLHGLILSRALYNNTMDLGVGFVITQDSADEIVDFANLFKNTPITYCQYKPEIVNREREDGVQRTIEFWQRIKPALEEAKSILGDKFQINDYKLDDLTNDPEFFGRTYKKCIGSQLQPCIGADGHVYVCTNHRGYKEYSYGSLFEKSFEEIWDDITKRQQVMHQIEEVEKFSKCTKLCKPHESNKGCWKISEFLKTLPFPEQYKEAILSTQGKFKIKHPEFI